MAKTTTTGKVWDAYFTGVALVANETEVLANSGFEAGVHFISLDRILNREISIREYSDLEIQQIALSGFTRFRGVAESSVASLLPTR